MEPRTLTLYGKIIKTYILDSLCQENMVCLGGRWRSFIITEFACLRIFYAAKYRKRIPQTKATMATRVLFLIFLFVLIVDVTRQSDEDLDTNDDDIQQNADSDSDNKDDENVEQKSKVWPWP